MRARAAADVTQELANVAGDVMAAARRLGFRRKANIHPVEALDDARVAIAATALAFVDLDSFPTAEQHAGLVASLRDRLLMAEDEAKEALILGRWLVHECGGPLAAIDRLSRRIYKLSGGDGFQPLMQVIKDVAALGTGVSDRQKEGLEEIARRFRLGKS